MTYYGIENFKQSILFVDHYRNYSSISMVSFLGETKLDGDQFNELRQILNIVVIPDDIIKKIELKNYHLKINFSYKYKKNYYNCFFNFHVGNEFKMYRGLSIFLDHCFYDLILRSSNQNFDFDYLLCLLIDYLNINKISDQTPEDKINELHKYLDVFSSIDEWIIRARKFESHNNSIIISGKNESEIIKSMLKIY